MAPMVLDPDGLLNAARDLLQRPDAATAGIWPRAGAFLARQALEEALAVIWRVRAPGLERCPMRAQLLCLPEFLGRASNTTRGAGGAANAGRGAGSRPDEALAERVSYAWSGLSRACHQHAYELPPTATELQAWIETVEKLVETLPGGSLPVR